jgi:hypothetical protein
LKNKKKIGSRSQKQGAEAESLVIRKLQKSGWTVIPTKASKSPLDLIAYNKRKRLWWGIQVKSATSGMTFDPKRLANICLDLYLDPVLAFVKVKKLRDVQFCMQKNGRLYHILEKGTFSNHKNYHILGAQWDCAYFDSKISLKF